MSKRNIRGYERPGGKLFLILFTVFIFLFLGTIFLSYTLNTETLTPRDLYKGEILSLDDNDSLSFKFQKEKHKLNVTVFGYNSIDITVYSDPVTKHIKINESAFFDLNGDGKNDLRVWLKEIVYYNAIIEFKRIDGIFCSSEWDCGKWGSCVDGLRKRTCEDINRCGKQEESPILEMFCSDVIGGEEEIIENVPEEKPVVELNNQSLTNLSNETSLEDSGGLNFYNPGSDFFIGNGDLTCLGNGGEICVDNQKCQGKWLNASDSLRCCYGECYFYESALNGLNSSISCDKSKTSFRLAVYNCTPFVMDCIENILVFELGVVHGFESKFEIKGQLGDNCLFEYSYGDVFLNYSQEEYTSLIEEGKTVGQINYELEILETEHINKFKDKTMVCEYPQDEFLIFARAWEDGDIEWSRDLLGKYDCSGDLVGL